jgi:hypothetical protein
MEDVFRPRWTHSVVVVVVGGGVRTSLTGARWMVFSRLKIESFLFLFLLLCEGKDFARREYTRIKFKFCFEIQLHFSLCYK